MIKQILVNYLVFLQQTADKSNVPIILCHVPKPLLLSADCQININVIWS